MIPGLYERIVNKVVERAISGLGEKGLHPALEKLDPADSHSYLAQYVHKMVEEALEQVKPGHDADRLSLQVALCNRVIECLAHSANFDQTENFVSDSSPCRLVSVSEAEGPQPRPDTPLALGALLTGTRHDPPLSLQLQKEMASADAVDILCSFIKWSGVRILEDHFRAFTARPGARLRIITTSYMGATDIKAIDFLCALPNTEVKVSYDTHRTRLHAKSYIFHRGTGFGSAYIGSANLSNPALTEGLEWNVKVSQYEQPYQWEKVTATFETYWNDGEFETCRSGDLKRMQAALLAERGQGREDSGAEVSFDLRPYAFQQEILDRVQAERELSGRRNHLIVAATGTGKTMIAAFDFKRWRIAFKLKNSNREPRVLFVAHREEILKQSMRTFRHVLRDYNFGDMLVNGIDPAQTDQLFISIQSYNSRQFSDMLDAKHYDYVIIDEFHHAAADTYQYLLEHIKPLSLIGLTATPERADGKEKEIIEKYFGDHISAEIRLPDAINRKLLSPFQYFAVSDSEDYSQLRWQRGGYAAADLDNLVSSNDIRAALVIRQVKEKLLDCVLARGIGFCVSKKHAAFMARKFNEAGIRADHLTSDSSDADRRSVPKKLVDREINFIFTVDLFNEGIDIPELDTVLFLRPTESLTVYLQQLGRGLRLAEGKECLTVLDFVGQAHRNFRFDMRFRALLTERNRQIDEEIEAGLPHLPAGCTFQLEKKAREYILENIRQSLRICRHAELIRKIATFGEDTGKRLTLANFIDHYDIVPDDIYRRSTWTRLCSDARVRQVSREADEEQLQKGFRRISHVDDGAQIEFLLNMLANDDFSVPNLSNIERRRILMAHFSLSGRGRGGAVDLIESVAKLKRNPAHAAELVELLKYRRDAIDHVPRSAMLPYECPLALHSSYTRDEILAALGYWTEEQQPEMREGVCYIDPIRTDVFLITLNKTEGSYSPTTMYDDYAISDTLFHLQSQSTTSDSSPTGTRYINHLERGVTVLLFVREEKKNAGGLANPYYFLGPADHVSHSGSKPMNIVWRLRTPMPARLLRQTARLAVC